VEHVSAAASIYQQDENGITLPCDGITLDEIGNEYQVEVM
jgi:hypothetical protein